MEKKYKYKEAELYALIGRNVKYYRQLYNITKGKMTQENLAELINVSTSLIGNLESSKTKQGISVYTLWKICDALEVSIEQLFDESEFEDRLKK